MSLLAALTLSLASVAATPPTPVVRRDRWRQTLSLGAAAGVGGPLGVVGAFLEYRPFRWVAAALGAGAGGSFGPAVAATLYVDPLVLRAFALGVGAGWSHNFSIVRGEVLPGRPSLPDATNWVNVEVQAQLRPSRHVQLRLGAGRGFLLNPGAFHLASTEELSQASLPSFPFTTPLDAVRAAARNESFGVWFVHLDLAYVFRL